MSPLITVSLFAILAAVVNLALVHPGDATVIWDEREFEEWFPNLGHGDTQCVLNATAPAESPSPILVTPNMEPTVAGQIGDDSTIELDGPYEIAIFGNDAGTYAIVAAYESDTVLIIDITDPSNPTEMATVLSDANFAFIGPVVVKVFEDGTDTYAIVGFRNWIGIIDITDPSNPSKIAHVNDTDHPLGGHNSAAVFENGTDTYAIVTAYNGNGIKIINITDTSNPPVVGIVRDSIRYLLNGPIDIEVFGAGTDTFAIVTAYKSDTVLIIDITDPLRPAVVASVTDSVGTYQDIRDSPSSPTDIANAGGGTILTLDGAWNVAVFENDAGTFAIVTAYDCDAIQIIDITDPLNPTALANIVDNDNVVLDGPTDIKILDGGNNTYAVVASYDNNTIQIIDITDPLNPTVMANAVDNDSIVLDGPTDIDVFEKGTGAYVAITSYNTDTVPILWFDFDTRHAGMPNGAESPEYASALSTIRMWSGLELEPATDAQLLASLDLDYPGAEIPNWMMANLGPMVARGDVTAGEFVAALKYVLDAIYPRMHS